MLNVTFYGVRGSTPCSGESTRRYGGNTSCVALEAPGQDPIVLDLGTGARYFGQHHPCDRPFRGTALVTHLHWDHIQGLPFFTPTLRPGGELSVFGPRQGGGRSVFDAFDLCIRPPFFPVDMTAFGGEFTFAEAHEDTFEVGRAVVTARTVPHVGPTNGYRVEWGGVTVAYISDHQMPQDGALAVPDAVLELCRGADLVIHDAQYTAAEFALKRHWGHCTQEFALHVAREAGARRLCLFHHDPLRGDDELDEMAAMVATRCAGAGMEVFVAAEGLTVSFEG